MATTTIDDFTDAQTVADACRAAPTGVATGVEGRQLDETGPSTTEIVGSQLVLDANTGDASSCNWGTLTPGGCGLSMSMDVTGADALVFDFDDLIPTDVMDQLVRCQVQWGAGPTTSSATFDASGSGGPGTLTFRNPSSTVPGTLGVALLAPTITDWGDIRGIQLEFDNGSFAGSLEGTINSIVAADPHIKCLDGSRSELYAEGVYRLLDYTCIRSGERFVLNAEVRDTVTHRVWGAVFRPDGAVVPDSEVEKAFSELDPAASGPFEHTWRVGGGEASFHLTLDKRYDTVGLRTELSRNPVLFTAGGAMAGELNGGHLVGGIRDVTPSALHAVRPGLWKSSAVATQCLDPHIVTASGRRVDPPAGDFVLLESMDGLESPDGWFRLRGSWVPGKGLDKEALVLDVNGTEVADAVAESDQEWVFRVGGEGDEGDQGATSILVRVFANGAVTVATRGRRSAHDVFWGALVDTPMEATAIASRGEAVAPVAEKVAREWLPTCADAPLYVREMEPHLMTAA